MKTKINQEFSGTINDVEINKSELYQAIINDITAAVDKGLMTEEQSNSPELIVRLVESYHTLDTHSDKWEHNCLISDVIESFFTGDKK